MDNRTAVKAGIVFVAMCHDRKSSSGVAASPTIGFPTSRDKAEATLAAHVAGCPLSRHEVRNLR
jgi:hypothetical protein